MIHGENTKFETMEDYDNFHYEDRLLNREQKNKEIQRLNKVFKPELLKAHFKTAENYSNVSYAKRLQVGSLVVATNGSMLCGYNGMVSGFPNQCEYHDRDETRKEGLHAESNTISKAAHSPVTLKNATLFVTHINCIECAKLTVQSGVRRVVFKHTYRLDEGLKLLVAKGVQVIHMNEDYSINKIYNKFTPEIDTEMFYLMNYLNDFNQ